MLSQRDRPGAVYTVRTEEDPEEYSEEMPRFKGKTKEVKSGKIHRRPTKKLENYIQETPLVSTE